MTAWPERDLDTIAKLDDLHVAPLRDDGVTCGTPTWIWSVVVDAGLYIRPYNGKDSRWYRSAMRQKAGRIISGGVTREVTFEAIGASTINDRVDAAYRSKYGGSPYLAAMIGERSRSTTVRVSPGES